MSAVVVSLTQIYFLTGEKTRTFRCWSRTMLKRLLTIWLLMQVMAISATAQRVQRSRTRAIGRERARQSTQDPTEGFGSALAYDGSVSGLQRAANTNDGDTWRYQGGSKSHRCPHRLEAQRVADRSTSAT